MGVFSRRAITTMLLPAAALYARCRSPSIRILMYHRVDRLDRYDQLTVDPDRFARQIAHLARRHRLLSLADALAELDGAGPRRDGVVVTFDDGYRDNLVHAIPVLRRHGVPATIFVTASFCGQSHRHPRYPGEDRLHLDWKELRDIARDPLITVGSHTLTHPFLSRLPIPSARDEIATSRDVIGREIGRPVDFFCYPSGDFGAREVAMVRAAGYRAAVSVAPGANRAGAARFALRRTEVTDRDEPIDLASKLCGAYDPPHAVLHLRRQLAAARARRTPAIRSGGP